MTKIKALSVLQCREYIFGQIGEPGVAQLKAALSEKVRVEYFNESLMPPDWVELDTVVTLTVTYDKLFGSGDGRAAGTMVRSLAHQHVHGIYRPLFVTAPTPLQVLEKAGRLWNRYYDHGESSIDVKTENHAVKRIIGCQDLPLQHDWLVLPYYEELLRSAGARDVTSKHLRCVALGAEYCESDIRWR
jgi:hypothetical protein